jgi:signal transduction histidine kinase
MATILVVDDKAVNRSILTTLLGYGGHRTLEASNGSEALDKTRGENPDLVITDILMPNMDGYELVQKLQELDAARRPQVIFYSATYLEEDAQALARSCGVSHVLTKPAEPEQILKIVDEALACGRADLPRVYESTPTIEAVRVLSNKLYRKVEEVKDLNAQLEQRITERTASLASVNRLLQQHIYERQKAEDQAAQSREEQLKMKGEFLSHVSHELRSPLTAVHQFTTILLDGLGGPLTSDQHEYLEITLRNVNQLKCMIDDLLEASRADTRKLTIRRSSISVADVIDQAVKSHSAIAAEKGISLKTDVSPDLPRVYADPVRISQVLTNLLDNAVKFSLPSSVITIHAHTFKDDPSFLCVSVADCGCGIAPEDFERIFDRLYQLPKPGEAGRRGLGLGLFICKEIVGRHDGRIWVSSESGKGSTLLFTLPVFSIASLLSPLLARGGQSASSLVLVTVTIRAVKGWSSEQERERTLHRVQDVLQRCILADLDVLLPPQSHLEKGDVFSVVARTDARGARVVVGRIKEQLSLCDDLNIADIDRAIAHHIVDLAAVAEGRSSESLLSCVVERVEQLLKDENVERS